MYIVVKEKHTATQTALAAAEDLLQTLLTGLASSSRSLPVAVDTWVRFQTCTQLAHAAPKKKQACVQLNMSRRVLGELEKRWKAVEREADQAKRDIKMRAKVESLWKKADATG